MRKFPFAILIVILCILSVASCSKTGGNTEETNEPPALPSNPSPSDGDTGVSVSQLLRWASSDPDPGDTLVYDVFLCSSNPPDSMIVSGWNRSNYAPGLLNVNTKYYWRVTAHDNHGNSVTGPVWNFTTLKKFPTSGLVAYYPFNGNANDESGNGYNGTPLNGIQLTTDRFGNGSSAYHFDGIDDYILLSNSSGVDLGSNFTLTAFLFTEAPSAPSDSQYYTIIAKRDEVLSGNASLYPWNFGIDYSTNDNFRKLLLMRTGCLIRSNFIVTEGYWDFVSLTVSNDTATFWVNAVRRDQYLLTSGNIITDQPILIGWNRLNHQQFRGKIDDLRIFSRPLSEAEILELSKEGL
jgi:hypothetical protein